MVVVQQMFMEHGGPGVSRRARTPVLSRYFKERRKIQTEQQVVKVMSNGTKCHEENYLGQSVVTAGGGSPVWAW